MNAWLRRAVRRAVNATAVGARRLARGAPRSAGPEEDLSWAAAYPQLCEHGWARLRDLCVMLMARTGGAVFGGPLAGMRLVPGSYLASFPPFVIGCYERELHHVLNSLVVCPPATVIDIGSAHGYYTTGLARLLPLARVVGFEADVGLWKDAAALAALNSVGDRISQLGRCDPQHLAEVCPGHSFVMCDCEGGEGEILDPVRVPGLLTSTIVCELHEFYVAGLTGTLVRRFGRTHSLDILLEAGRDPNDYRVLWGLPEPLRWVAVQESRHVNGVLTGARFMVMTPLAGQGPRESARPIDAGC